MMQNNLNKNAMLVHLSISQWYNQTTDRNVAKHIAEEYNLGESASNKYVKSLLPKGAMADLQRTITSTRQMHYSMTLPWEDGGMRILPSQAYFEYVAQMNRLKEQFDSQVDTLVKSFRNWKEKAKETNQGLYAEEDFPSEEKLRGLFRINTSFYPFPVSYDFRLDLDEETCKEISANNGKAYELASRQAATFLKEKVFAHLRAYAFAVNRKGFHASTVNKMIELTEMIPVLNISNDEQISMLHRQLVENICPHGADVLRENEELRTKAVAEATRILHEFSSASEG